MELQRAALAAVVVVVIVVAAMALWRHQMEFMLIVARVDASIGITLHVLKWLAFYVRTYRKHLIYRILFIVNIIILNW